MTVIQLSSQIREQLESRLSFGIGDEKFGDIFASDLNLVQFIEDLKFILDEDLYVHIKGLGLEGDKANTLLELLAEQFGVYYGQVESTDIKVKCNYTGCSRHKLVLHNDDAIDLKTQPKVGFIQVVEDDPILEVRNGIVRAKDLVYVLKHEDPELLLRLFETKIPMLSFGVNYDGSDRQKILVNEPILSENGGRYFFRFDSYRNKFFYKYNRISQEAEESKLIYDFLRWCNEVKKEVTLAKGDILVHKNQETLHDRGACSIEYRADGNLRTRKIIVTFAR